MRLENIRKRFQAENHSDVNFTIILCYQKGTPPPTQPELNQDLHLHQTPEAIHRLQIHGKLKSSDENSTAYIWRIEVQFVK